jgi:prephenate dehydratase
MAAGAGTQSRGAGEHTGSELPKVGYLGPAGTFSEEALLASAPPGSVEPVPFATIYEVVLAVRAGTVRWAVVPIENSLDGSVTVTLDLLAETGTRAAGECHPASVDEHGDLEIVGEALLAVGHALIACGRVELGDIDTVLSHPQVPGQCTRLLRGELAHAQVLAASSTAEAVRRVVAEGRPGQAALGTTLAAEIYGGVVLRDAVQDRDDNVTRFVWLGRVGKPADRSKSADALPPWLRKVDEKWKTSLVFWGAGAESPGWLVRCLDAFAQRSINLTKIESRPQRATLGHYVFFVDLQGERREPVVAAAIAALGEVCEQVRVLGSYPVG